MSSSPSASPNMEYRVEQTEAVREAVKRFMPEEHQQNEEGFETKVSEERLQNKANESEIDLMLRETREEIAELDRRMPNQGQELGLQLNQVEEDDQRDRQEPNEVISMQPLQVQQTNMPPPVELEDNPMPIVSNLDGNRRVKRRHSSSLSLRPRLYKRGKLCSIG